MGVLAGAGVCIESGLPDIVLTGMMAPGRPLNAGAWVASGTNKGWPPSAALEAPGVRICPPATTTAEPAALVLRLTGTLLMVIGASPGFSVIEPTTAN